MGPDAAEVAEAAPVAPHALTPTRRREGAADLSSAVYGSLLVMALVAAQARSDVSAELIAGTLLVAVAVFWLMEVWSELVNHRVRGPITRTQAWEIAREESPMLSAAVVPALILSSASLGITTVDRAIDIALAVGVVQLFLWGLAVGRAVGRGWVVALVVALVDCGLGLAIAGLKVLVIH